MDDVGSLWSCYWLTVLLHETGRIARALEYVDDDGGGGGWDGMGVPTNEFL